MRFSCNAASVLRPIVGGAKGRSGRDHLSTTTRGCDDPLRPAPGGPRARQMPATARRRDPETRPREHKAGSPRRVDERSTCGSLGIVIHRGVDAAPSLWRRPLADYVEDLRLHALADAPKKNPRSAGVLNNDTVGKFGDLTDLAATRNSKSGKAQAQQSQRRGLGNHPTTARRSRQVERHIEGLGDARSLEVDN